jgi:hypothetical protein
MSHNPEKRAFRGRSYKKGGTPIVELKERSLEEVRAIILENGRCNAPSPYQGLTSSEIAHYNRRLMFGANDEAFPSQEEWSRIVD